MLFGMEKTMAKKRMTKKERMRQRRRRQRMMFGGGLLLVAVVFTVILLLLGSKGCGTSKAEGDEVEAVPSAEATEAPTAEPTPTPEPVPSVDISDINSRSGILVRLSDGKVVAEKDADAKIYPASMTKIMTAVVGLENLSDQNETITIDRDTYDRLYTEGASLAGFGAGDEVKAIDILYGVMLPSGAECCIALADTIAGSEADFVTLMNEKAAKLGMTGTNFCDTTGLHDANHYSTARDIAVLLKYALKDDTFREIIESPYHSTPGTNIHPDGITFYSTMFKNLSDTAVTDGKIMGGKTGYTGEAGHCLASFAEIDGTEYILVTGGASGTGIPHINDAVTVYNRLGAAAQTLKAE